MDRKKPEIFISIDTENNGPIPGVYSMLSIGAAAYTLDKEVISTFSRNLAPLPGAVEDEKTMEWWAARTQAYEAATRNPSDPALAMAEFQDWLETLPGKPVMMCFPLAYDFSFYHWYAIRFTGRDPLGFTGYCIQNQLSALLGVPLKECHGESKHMAPWKQRDMLHTHVALDDALEQGAMGINILRACRKLPAIEAVRRLDLTASGSLEPN